MKNTFRYLTILLVYIIFACSCNPNNRAGTTSLPYSKVEIYCACMSSVQSNEGYIVMQNCTTPGHTGPDKLIKKELLYYSTSDTNVINSFWNVFFKNNHKSETLIDGQDAGFVILMKKSEFIADTLVFSNTDQAVFTFNEKYKLTYSINIIDSVRKLIGKEHIECESKAR